MKRSELEVVIPSSHFLDSLIYFYFCICSSSLGQTLASGFECCIEKEVDPEKLFEWHQHICRLLHQTSEISPDLISLLQMCLVNLVGQILSKYSESEVEGRTSFDFEQNLESLIVPLLSLPACDAKMLCLAKIQMLIEFL